MPETRVVNIKSGEPYDLYIGRTAPREGLKASKWANPFHIGEDGTRQQVIAKYRAYMERRPRLLDELPELQGKVLACWCAPLPCHGDVLAELADEGQPGGQEA